MSNTDPVFIEVEVTRKTRERVGMERAQVHALVCAVMGFIKQFAAAPGPGLTSFSNGELADKFIDHHMEVDTRA